MTRIPKPQPDESYPYMFQYIDLVPDDGQVLKHLETSHEGVEKLIRSFSDADRTTPHAPGEWTVQEILGHLVDTERIIAYRAFCFARGEKQDLNGFEPNDYATASNAKSRDIDNLLAEYRAVRASTVAMFRGFSEEILNRRGTASGGKPYSVRAAAYIIAGHEQWHIKSIHENYGSRLPQKAAVSPYRPLSDLTETR